MALKEFALFAQENQHQQTQCHFERRYSVNVQDGMLDNNMIGPHVIEERLAAPYYRNFLENKLPLYLEDATLATRGRMRHQHHESPPHFSSGVTKFVNKK
jgi:hypothetical protein